MGSVTALSRTLAARATALCTALATGLAVALTRLRRLEVTGESMRPALMDGDRVLVWRTRRLREGQVVALRDPRRPGRMMVKRVTGVRPAGRRASVVVHGDNPEASTDSRVFGPVGAELVLGRVVYRYHPPERAGRISPVRARDATRPVPNQDRR